MAENNPWDVTAKQPNVSMPSNIWAGGDNSQSAITDPSKIPTFNAAQYGESPELQDMLQGKGFSDQTLANMRATSMQAPAAAGAQEMANVKRALAANGLGSNPAGAGYQENVAKRTGEAQTAALHGVDMANAQLQEQQKQLGLQQQTDIGKSNMAAANAAAMTQWQQILNASLQNQAVRFGTQQAVSNMG
jgi:hypothetical protein